MRLILSVLLLASALFTGCTTNSKREKLLKKHQSNVENEWLEKKSHYRGVASRPHE